MRLSPLKIYTLKLTLFSTVLAYLAVDMWWWHGPLWQAMHPQGDDTPAAKQNVVAEVLGEQITAEQWERYVMEQNFMAGRASADQLRRTSLLMDMVRAATLRIRTRYNDKNLPDCRSAAEEEVRRMASRARTPEQFEGWVRSQGYKSVEELTDRLEVRLRSLSQLERAIAPHCAVTDEDVAKHYELIKDQLVEPERRSVKHIFLETLGKDEQQVQQKAQELLARLQQGEDFQKLARECSEDLHSAPKGGELGIIRNDERRPLPELPLFGEQAIPAATPQMVKSRWGWHIIEAGEIAPARTLTLRECQDSLRSALISAQREIAIDTYFTTGVREAIRRQSIKINHVK